MNNVSCDVSRFVELHWQLVILHGYGVAAIRTYYGRRLIRGSLAITAVVPYLLLNHRLNALCCLLQVNYVGVNTYDCCL